MPEDSRVPAVVAPHWLTVAQAHGRAAHGQPWPISGDHTARARRDAPTQ